MYATGHSLEVQEYMDSLNSDIGEPLTPELQLGKLDFEMSHTAETMLATERLKEGSNYYAHQN